MNDLCNGERQVAPTTDGIRRDHVARYEWARTLIAAAGSAAHRDVPAVLDFACGVGYGASILAADASVVAVDRSSEALAYGAANYARPGVSFEAGEVDTLRRYHRDAFDWIVCFETLEHLPDPDAALRQFHRLAPRLIVSVPNEDVFPHQGRIRFHERHYRPGELVEILERCGWQVREWHGQAGPESEVEPSREGRTLVAVCDRVPDGGKPTSAPWQAKTLKHVAILGLGPSLERYVDYVKRLGSRAAFCDEVWGINAVGDVLACDRIFHMDDVRVQERRAEAAPESNIANMVRWLRTHPGPIYTSQVVEGYPGLVEFPLEDVINELGRAYFNSTAAYAVAYAIFLGVEEISLFGIDFSYPNSHHAEKGRACVEFWLGVAASRGIRIGVPENTSLLDTIEGEDAATYGYDAVKVRIEEEGGVARVRFEPRDLPTAAEIEARYDHTKSTVNPALRGQPS